jgi:hypothetical protein
MGGHDAQLVLVSTSPTRASASPRSMAVMVACMRSIGRKTRRAQITAKMAATAWPARNSPTTMAKVCCGPGERSFEKADIEHADPLLMAIEQRFIGRDIPVIDHKGAVQPGSPFIEHRIACTAAETRVPIARPPSNSRTLVATRTSPRNKVAVPALPTGKAPSG